ncbi:Rgg family transcriptional regulator [Ligilactobacillus sp. LYQ135]
MSVKNYGETISSMRKAKNIKVNKLINGIMSSSTYVRFISGEAQTSVNNFISLLENLHISFDEFKYIDDGYQPDVIQNLMLSIREAVVKDDVAKLKEYLEQVKTRQQMEVDNQELEHVKCALKLTINRLQHESYDEVAKKTIINYLSTCEIWTHYELALFNNCIFIFDIEQIKTFSKRVVRNLERYQNMRVYGSESFRVLVNIMMIYISKGTLNDIVETLIKMNHFKLESDMLFEKNLRLYFNGLVQLIQKKQEGIKQVKKALNIFELLDAKQYADLFDKFLNYTTKKYKLD